MRGRDIAGVIEQYTKFVKPAFDTFVAPSRKHADVIIPWGRSAAVPQIKACISHTQVLNGSDTEPGDQTTGVLARLEMSSAFKAQRLRFVKTASSGTLHA